MSTIFERSRKGFATYFIISSIFFGGVLGLMANPVTVEAKLVCSEDPESILDRAAGETCENTRSKCICSVLPDDAVVGENSEVVPTGDDLVKAALSWAIDATVGKLLLGIAKLIFWVSGIFMMTMGVLLDYALQQTITSELYNNLKMVNTGWMVMRDIANMFFIFILLYIAITTILGLSGHSTKTMLRNVILAALLINFSLFFTKVIIDAGNIIAVGFWNNMGVQKITLTDGTQKEAPTGPSAALRKSFDIQTVVSAVDTGDNMMTATVFAGGSILLFIIGFVFLAGAIMMIVRTITLLFLMILSPFGFIGLVIPKTSGFAHKWWDRLINESILAPVFLGMLYIVIQIVSLGGLNILTSGSKEGATFAGLFTGKFSSIAILYSFFLICGLTIGSLKVAQSVAGDTAKVGIGWAKTVSGFMAGGAVGGMAALGQRGIGGSAEWLRQQKKLQDAATEKGIKGMLARTVISGSSKAATASYDMRGSTVGRYVASFGGSIDAGKAKGEGGERARRAKRDAELVAKAEAMFPGNPHARDEYIRNHSYTAGSIVTGAVDSAKNARLKSRAETLYPGDIDAQKEWMYKNGYKEAKYSDYDQKPGQYATKEARVLSEAKEKIAGQKATEENKQAFDAAAKTGEEFNKKLDELNEKRLELERTGQGADQALLNEISATAAALKPFSDQVRKSIQRMSSEDVAKLMDKAEYREEGSIVRKNLQGKDYLAVNKRFMEGKYKDSMGNDDQAMIASLTVEALKSDSVSPGAKKAIKTQIKNGTWGHEIDFRGDLEEMIKEGNAQRDPARIAEYKKDLDEYWKMMDAEDRAELRELLLHKDVANRLTGADMGAIGKKGLEGYYDDIPDFKEKIDNLNQQGELGTARRTNTAAAHMQKNSNNKMSFFYGSKLSPQANAAAASITVSPARMSTIEAQIKRQNDLSNKLNTLNNLSAAEMSELSNLRNSLNGLKGDEKAYADMVRANNTQK